MKTLTAADNSTLQEFLKQAEQDDVVVLRDGKPVALITPFDQDDLAWYERERSEAFIQSIERARQQVKKGETVSHDDLKKELGL